VLPSSSCSLDFWGVTAELILARKFIHDVGKFQGFVNNQSYGKIRGDPSCMVPMGKISQNDTYSRIFVLGGVPGERLGKVFILFHIDIDIDIDIFVNCN
jgi:hypothetical protein